MKEKNHEEKSGGQTTPTQQGLEFLSGFAKGCTVVD